MLNLWKKLKGQVKAPVSAELSGKAEALPSGYDQASDETGAQALCQALVVNGKHLVFGGAWTPVTEETGWKKILNIAFNEGYAHHVLNEYESTVGLFGALPKNVKNAHAAALVFAQHFSAGGVELFVFQSGEQCGLVGLMEYAPIPGYDVMGTQEEIQQIIHEFNDINTSQLVHSYGNVSWVDDIQPLELNKVAYKADVKSKLKRIPNIKLRVLMGLVGMVFVATCLYGFQQYLDMRQAEQDALNATSQNPNLMYEQSLAFALKTAGEPGSRNVQVWRQFFAKVPLNVGGWNFKTLECKQLVCDIVWVRSSGTFKSFETQLPPALKATTGLKIDNELVKAEVVTQHKLNDTVAVNSKKGLDLKTLPVEQEVQKLWGSQLQDLSLLKNLNVSLGKTSLFGGQGNVAELMRPIVKGAWSIEHDIWSLPELPMPDYVVPENLKIALSGAREFRYKIEGSYYAKAK
ncbi:type 4b pilus protein PilO2 [Limnohabitans sp.]|uniref:type 4b pilus protein PilO2 n=1 Tax=Limnohabitans sp. TaxID=1907725 RepID=UPI00286FA9A5|nr:type 4b pilus protein PilO2 [Limnohabitans sp.]